MADFSFTEGAGHTAFKAVGASSIGAEATASNSANTKGAYVSMGTQAQGDSGGMLLVVQRINPKTHTPLKMLFDIAVGTGGSEKILVSNLHMDCVALDYSGAMVHLPLALPGNEELWLRCQSSNSSGVNTPTISAQVRTWLPGSKTPLPIAGSETLGANTSDSGLTAIDPGGTINTKGSWVSLGTCAHHVQALIVNLGHDGTDPTGVIDPEWLVDIGIGTGGSQVVLIPDLSVAHSRNSKGFKPPFIGPFPVQIPSGTEIWARCQCTDNTATDRLIDASVICFY